MNAQLPLFEPGEKQAVASITPSKRPKIMATKPLSLDKQIEAKLLQINTVLCLPPTAWRLHETAGFGERYLPEGGNIHLDSAYGKYCVVRMSMVGSGESPVFDHGYSGKRIILNQLDAYYKGILAGYTMREQQVS